MNETLKEILIAFFTGAGLGIIFIFLFHIAIEYSPFDYIWRQIFLYKRRNQKLNSWARALKKRNPEQFAIYKSKKHRAYGKKKKN